VRIKREKEEKRTKKKKKKKKREEEKRCIKVSKLPLSMGDGNILKEVRKLSTLNEQQYHHHCVDKKYSSWIEKD
jgi:hypothetical protein